MKKRLAVALLLLLGMQAAAENWTVLHSEKFGFSMLTPQGAAWEGADWGNGWGGCRTQQGVYRFGALVRLGVNANSTELETAAVLLSQIPPANWRLVEQSQQVNGWTWRRTYRVQSGQELLYTVLGTGVRGSYVLFMQTTATDLLVNQDLYRQWFESLTLY